MKKKRNSIDESTRFEIDDFESDSSVNSVMDEHLITSSFELGNSISKGIPWNSYSEEEIHLILKIHFEILGFTVIWRHKDDPANERGVDLECIHEKEGTKILIAVKKKPGKNALGQVVELSNTAADDRAYVFIGGATQSFRDNIRNFSNILFMNEDNLEDILNESGLTLKLKIDNSQANVAMISIMRNILKSIDNKSNRTGLPKPTVNILETLWGMKDRSVTLHRCSGMIPLMFEDSNRVGETTQEQAQNLVVWCLDYLYVYALFSLQKAFETLTPDLHALLFYVHKETKSRSNWFELYTYSPGLLPGRVFSAYQKLEKERRKWKSAEKLLNKIRARSNEKEQEIMKSSNALEINTVTEKISKLHVWAHGLESTIDYLFDYWIRSYEKTPS